MFLFFDVETNGLPKVRSGNFEDIDNWPRIVQISWAIFNENGNRIYFKDYIIRAIDFKISNNSRKIHGISQEKSLNEGVGIGQVLEEINLDLIRISTIVCHNIDFDLPTLNAEFLRNKIQTDILSKERFCTMKSPKIVSFCQKPNPFGNGYKWPSLSELHLKLFDTLFEDSHNAKSDVDTCAKCYFELKRREII
jgi:DNA polymerase III epsilon subunit-like protein